MNKGCIYYDESSRGKNCSKAGTDKKRGRWVGEKNIDGKRVRMRSTDLSKVMEWMNQPHHGNNDGRYKRPKTHREKVDTTNLLPIPGCPGYYADVEGFYIANHLGFKINPYRAGRGKNNYQFKLTIDSKTYGISASRVMYAAIHGIDVFKIPASLVVVRTEEGDYKLYHKGDYARIMTKKGHMTRQNNVSECLNKKIEEAQILQRYYANSDASELLRYTIQQTNRLAAYIHYNYSWGVERSMDVALEAVEWFCQRIKECNLAVTSIYGSLLNKTRDIVRTQQRMKNIDFDLHFTSNVKRLND